MAFYSLCIALLLLPIKAQQDQTSWQIDAHNRPSVRLPCSYDSTLGMNKQKTKKELLIKLLFCNLQYKTFKEALQ